MVINFRFKEEAIENKTILRPKIPITLSHNGKKLTVLGLLDSGSDFIMIPKQIADFLDVPYSKKEEIVKGIASELKLLVGFVNMKIISSMML
jgi:predicted aspartyl protease